MDFLHELRNFLYQLAIISSLSGRIEREQNVTFLGTTETACYEYWNPFLIPVSITSVYVISNNCAEPLGVRPEMLHPWRSGAVFEAERT